MRLFGRNLFEKRAEEETKTVDGESSLLDALIGGDKTTKGIALQIPTIAGAIGLIANIVSSTPIKLYRIEENTVVECKKDHRISLLNDETGDALNACEFWKAIVFDYYLGKGGYAYVHREGGKIVSLHYVEEAAVVIAKNADPIFKDYDILVGAQRFKTYDFLKILRNSKDGAQGVGIVTENSKVIDVAYQSLIFERNVARKGGTKRGFLLATKRAGKEELAELKRAYNKIYSNSEDSETVVVLNEGTKFQESSVSSAEMQLNENKESNSRELCKLFHISPEAVIGHASQGEMTSIVKLAIAPLMKSIECALNRDFLMEREKGMLYWAFDTKELLRGELKERLDAYGVAVDKGIMTRNEARYAEDLPAIEGMDVISMSLADVIFDAKTGNYFTPNTKTVTSGTAMQPMNTAGVHLADKKRVAEKMESGAGEAQGRG